MHILLSSTCSACWPHGHTFSGGDLCVWNQNWKFGFNDKRPMSNLLLLFIYFFVSVICLFLGYVLCLIHAASTKWIQSLPLSVLTIRLFMLEGPKCVGRSDHTLSPSEFVYSMLTTLKIKKLSLSHFNSVSHSTSSLNDLGAVWYL